MSRNQKWMENKDKKFKKMKETADKQKMDQCTFKPKTQGKDFLLRQKHDKLKSKVSKSLSPQKIKLSEQFDLSVIKQARLRIERQDDQITNLADQVSPKRFPPSVKKNSKNPKKGQKNPKNLISESQTECDFYQNDSLPVSQPNESQKDEEIRNLKNSTPKIVAYNDENAVINLSKSPTFQHQILGKYSKTVSASKEPAKKEILILNEESKDLNPKAAKRLIFNDKVAELSQNCEIIEIEIEDENQALVDNTARVEMFHKVC